MGVGTQSILLIVWGLSWMLALSMVMVHPSFRRTRIQIRRSLRLHLNCWQTAQKRLRGRLKRFQGLLLIGLGKTMLWLAERLERRESPPLWIRIPLRFLGNLLWFYLFYHLIGHEKMTWQATLAYLVFSEVLDAARNAWKRRKQRLRATEPANPMLARPTGEQQMEP